MAKLHGHRYIALSRLLALLTLLVSLSGCERMMRDLQHSNIRTGLFPMNMVLTIGPGKTDARSLIGKQSYEGVVEREDVRVYYPMGMERRATILADAFHQAKTDVKNRTGTTWAFRPHIYLVPVSADRGGYRLRIRIKKQRDLQLPMLVNPSTPTFFDPEWSRGLAHELTEASMLSSLNRRELVLGDYCAAGISLVNRTRWFRDGVSDYAGDLMNSRLFGERYQPSARIYKSLMRVRGAVLDWDNCSRKLPDYEYYSASEALVRELINRSGEDAIARIMKAASEDKYINGGTLDRAVRKVTGLDLSGFTRNYRQTWLGADFSDSALLDGSIAQPGNAVRVTRVHPGTPADKWNLKPGDRIIAVDGSDVISSAWLVHYLAAKQPRERINVDWLMDGRRVSYRMVTAARYDDQM